MYMPAVLCVCRKIYCEELEQVLVEACASKICSVGWRPRKADGEVPVQKPSAAEFPLDLGEVSLLLYSGHHLIR